MGYESWSSNRGCVVCGRPVKHCVNDINFCLEHGVSFKEKISQAKIDIIDEMRDKQRRVTMKVTCKSQASKDQAGWGGGSDRQMEVGKQYELERVRVHSWHTKLFFKEFPGESFNSVNYTDEWKQLTDPHRNVQGTYYPDGRFEGDVRYV